MRLRLSALGVRSRWLGPGRSAEHADGDAVAGGPFGPVWRENPSDVELAEMTRPDIAVELGVTRLVGSFEDGVVAGEGTRREAVSVVRLVVVPLCAWNGVDGGRVHIEETDAGRESGLWIFRARSD